MAKSKKLTAVVAIGCAAVMTLSGTFAWILQQDETKLNSFSHAIPDYGVEIEEDFEAWVNKDVTVKATGTNEVIVRARFEEFLSIDGKTTDVAQQSGIYTTTALADAVNPNGNDIRKDASKLNPQIVDLYFGEKFITMAEWTTKTSGVTGTALSNIYNEGWWVIDTDGWCYYTKALGNFEESNLSLSNALLNVTDSELKETYGAPVNLDYNINVRVQAISADLSDYGATDNPAQWSCETTGRVIDDDTNVSNEILTDTPVIAASNADTLIRGISVSGGTIQQEGYVLALDAANSTAKITGFDSGVAAITDADGYNAETATLTMLTSVTYNGAEYMVTEIADNAFKESALLENINIVLPQRLNRIGALSFGSDKIIGELIIPESVNFIGESAFTATTFSDVRFAGDNETESTFYVIDAENEARELSLGSTVFSHMKNVTGEIRLPARTIYLGWYVFHSATFTDVTYPAETRCETSSYGTWYKFSGTHTTY